MSITTGIGERLGSWLGGAVYDRTSSYSFAFSTSIAALVIDTTVLWMM